MDEIEELNKWLEEQAAAWEKGIAEHPELRGSSWPEGFRSLKNIDKLSSFRISSCSMLDESPLITYLNRHKSEYTYQGYTGGCIFTKI